MRLIYSVSCWWLCWLVVAHLNLFGLTSLSPQATILTMIFIVSLWCGSMVQLNDRPRLSVQPLIEYKHVGKVSYLLLVILLALQVPTMLALLSDLASGIGRAEIRTSLFNGERFSNVEKLIFNWSAGLTFNFLLVCGFSCALVYKKYNFLFILFAYVIMSSILKGARGEIYQVIVMSVFLVFTFWSNNFATIAKRLGLLLIPAILSAVLILYYITQSRGDNNVLFQLIAYHTVGFALFSEFLNGKSCGLTSPTFSIASIFGGIEYLTTLIARYLFVDDLSTFSKASLSCQNLGLPLKLTTSVVIDKEYYAISSYNAYYTLLISGYNFIGSIGISILGLAFGFLTRFLHSRAAECDLVYTEYFIVISSILIMGVFSSSLDSVTLYFLLITINVKALYLLRISKL